MRENASDAELGSSSWVVHHFEAIVTGAVQMLTHHDLYHTV